MSNITKRSWNRRLRAELLEDRRLLATRIWDGGALLSNNWTNAANWVGDAAPVAGDNLVFPGGVSDRTADNNFPDGTAFNSISMSGGYTLKGNRIILGAGGVTSNNSGAPDVIKLDITLAGVDRTFNVGSGSTLFVDGKLFGSGLVKQGEGNLSLLAKNEYTGLTQVVAGQLFVKEDQGLGATSAATQVKSGATLVADHSDTLLGELRISEPIILENGSRLRGLREVVLDGPITTLGTAEIRQEGITEELHVNGPISGPGGLNITSENRVWFEGSQANTFQGTTSVFGDLFLGKYRVVTDPIPDTEGVTSIASTLEVKPGGSVTFRASNQIDDTADVIVRTSGRLRVNGFFEAVGALMLNGGEVSTQIVVPFLPSLLNTRPNQNPSGAMRIRGIVTASSTSSQNPAQIDGKLRLDGAIKFEVADGPAATDLVVNAQIESGALIKNGLGTMRLAGPGNDYDGTTRINAGTLEVYAVQRHSQVIVAPNATLAGTGTVGPLTVNAGGKVVPGGQNTTSKLRVDGNAVFEPGSIFAVFLNGPLAGPGHDQLDVNGSIGFQGALLVATVGPLSSVGDQFRIVNNDGSDLPDTPFFLNSTNPLNDGEAFLSSNGVRLRIDYRGGFNGNDVVLTRINTPTLAPGLALSAAEIDEGQKVVATGILFDPDAKDHLTLVVDWGDGSNAERIRPGKREFELEHIYRDNGTYRPRFSWFDQSGEGNSREFVLEVLNVAPSVNAGESITLVNGGKLVRPGSFTDPGEDAWTVSVDFGDGSGTLPVRQANGNFVLMHRYTEPGEYTVRVTVVDDDGGQGETSFTVKIVAGAAPARGAPLGQATPHWKRKDAFFDWLDQDQGNWLRYN
ncbi:MAG: autotransporter-associated beta strand repeat-containing protein [Planctomycetales bacterium]|nr:autotransporter-associated beta strand repeat-containing protein [Planctomycetales bacterium]